MSLLESFQGGKCPVIPRYFVLGVPMSRELLNTLHSLLSSPMNVSPIALFHVLKEALANQSVVEADSANANVEVTGVISRRKAQTPQ